MSGERSPEVTIKFYLPDNNEDLKDALDGSNWRMTLSEFDQWLRDEQKYNNKESLTISEIRAKLMDFITDNNLKIVE